MELSPVEFRKFEQLIYQTSGIRLQESKRTLLTNRLRRRVTALQLPGFDAYYRYLTSPGHAAELDEFLNAVTTNETHFFRTLPHFDWFRHTFLPERIAQAARGQQPRELRIWSAACSTGEEPYSLAICLAENQLRLTGWKLEVVGTDLSQDVLQRARTAVYREKSVDELDEKMLRRYFVSQPDPATWTLKPAVAKMVTFEQHNLLKPWKGPPFDCVFLRNVLIYFDRDSKIAAIKNVREALRPGGFLVLGPSEGAFDLMDGFEKLSTFLYCRQGA